VPVMGLRRAGHHPGAESALLAEERDCPAREQRVLCLRSKVTVRDTLGGGDPRID